MGKYLTAKEIKKNKEYLVKNLHAKSNYFVRNSIVQDLAVKYVDYDATIVEVGTGSGRLAKDLLGVGYGMLNLIDIDNYLSDDFDQDQIKFHSLDVSFGALPFEDNAVDLILAIAIIEHLENPVLITREAGRVLKKGGKFIVALPWVFSLRSKLEFLLKGDLKGYNRGNNHISLFTKAVFEKIFLKNFRIIETKYSHGYIKLFGRKIYQSKGKYKWVDKCFGNKVLYVFEKK